jgi:hypothetical protein
MFSEHPAQESHSKFYITSERNEDLKGNPSKAGIR